MSSYLFSGGGMKNFIVIPSAVIDRFLKDATGEELKILLYLIRNEDKQLDETTITEETGVCKVGIEDAIEHWIKCGVISKRGASLSFATPSYDSGHLPKYTGETIALRCRNDKKWEKLKNAAEQILGKLLNENDINTIFSIYDYLGLPDTVIGVLLEYCVSNGTASMKYIEKTAIAWADEQIYTLNAATRKVEALNKAKQLETKIASALGIMGRNFTTKEKGYIDKWTNTYGYGLNEIVYAYEQSADNTGKLSFPYMNKVLESAYNKGHKTVEQMQNAPKPQPKANNKKLKNNSEVSIDEKDLFVPFWEVMSAEGEEE